MKPIAAAALVIALCASADARDLKPVLSVSLGSELGQLRAAPVKLGSGERAFFVAYGPDFDVDPWHEMFFYPKGTLTVAVITAKGNVLWKRDLGRGVVPGIWFCPLYPMDLDGDGADEIWFVNNTDPVHPLSLRGLRLEGIDARTGKTVRHARWPAVEEQTISHTYRFFIFGGQVKGKPVLVTAQGTYDAMALQAWNPDMTIRWEHKIPAGPGPRGSHMTAIADLDGDGVDEVLWGERRIELAGGKQLSCADCAVYNGHSDVVEPYLDWATGEWRVYTCRESDGAAKPRVAAFDAKGKRIWGDLDNGHIDIGWIARLAANENPTAMAIRIKAKTLGPDGRFHDGVEEFFYDAFTGERKNVPFRGYRTLPVDLDGDGVHELVRGVPGGDGEVLDGSGRTLAKLGGTVAMASKFLDLPGEQVLCFYPDGSLRVWADADARDTENGRRRYAHPFYRANQALTANGYNLINLGGL